MQMPQVINQKSTWTFSLSIRLKSSPLHKRSHPRIGFAQGLTASSDAVFTGQLWIQRVVPGSQVIKAKIVFTLKVINFQALNLCGNDCFWIPPKHPRLFYCSRVKYSWTNVRDPDWIRGPGSCIRQIFGNFCNVLKIGWSNLLVHW